MDVEERSYMDLKNLLIETFNNKKWFKIFLDDTHHGYIHADQVRLSCLKLFDKLSKKEKLEIKGNYKDTVLAVEIAALFHDCGRFNKEGKVVLEEQISHHVLSSKRAKFFCEINNLTNIYPLIEDAILSHDFQNREITPHLNPPKTIVGKILQSADQIGWFHPNSIYRTLEYNKVLGSPFYKKNIDLQSRLNWKPGQKSNDALTVMLSQLYGPTGKDRFGIIAVRKKIKIYKEGLKENILKIAEENNVKNEVVRLINEYEKRILPKGSLL